MNYQLITFQWFLYLFVFDWSRRVCFGKLLKGPKLTKISPNKTYTGMVGSFITPIVFTFLIKNFDIFTASFITTNYKIYIFVIILSTASQIGDIIISYFKRLSKLKDTGNLIPGHGGILDRIDGMILFSIILFNKFF